MADFNTHTQNVSFLAADGQTRIDIPMNIIDLVGFESLSICISYGTQIGASIIMLLCVLIMTPSSKLRRPSNLLHVAGLTISIVRMTLLALYFVSPFNEFYNYWAGDQSGVGMRDYNVSIASCVFSLLLVIVIAAALMNQAWTMVHLWPALAKYALSGLSVAIALLSVGSKLAATVVQAQTILALSSPASYLWVIHWALVTNAVSICWFCALFNAKLIIHLVTNRGFLPSYKALTPMEILVMTNGILMIVPVIFCGLEWGQFFNFEAASLTLTSTAIILPLGSIAAQRMALAGNMALLSAGSSNSGGVFLSEPAGWRRWPASTPPKSASMTNSSATAQVSVMSRCEAGSLRDRDLELDASRDVAGGHVRVERDLEQRVDRVYQPLQPSGR